MPTQPATGMPGQAQALASMCQAALEQDAGCKERRTWFTSCSSMNSALSSACSQSSALAGSTLTWLARGVPGSACTRTVIPSDRPWQAARAAGTSRALLVLAAPDQATYQRLPFGPVTNGVRSACCAHKLWQGPPSDYSGMLNHQATALEAWPFLPEGEDNCRTSGIGLCPSSSRAT